MSYLTTPELHSFKKAVISFWFKVPQAALDAALKEEDDWHDAHRGDAEAEPPPLLGLVPLVVFGKEGTSRSKTESHNTSTPFTESTTITSCVEYASDSLTPTSLTMTAWSECDSHTSTRTYYKGDISYSAKPGKPVNPSLIAIDGDGNLIINFESTQTGNVVLPYAITSVTPEYYTQPTIDECWTFPIVGYCGDYENTITVFPGNIWGVFELVFTLLGWRIGTAVPDFYVDQGSSPREYHESESTYGSTPGDVGTGAISFSPPVTLVADTWHHVVVSVDMTGGSASRGLAVGESGGNDAGHVSASSLLYVAVDDKNYPTGGSLFPGTNKVITGGALSVIGTMQAAKYEGNTSSPVGPVPSYSLKDMSVPAAKVGIPSVGKYVDKIRKVEMAELLFFTDVTLDTSVEANRRHFITDKNKKGEQLPTNSTPLSIPMRKYAVGDAAAWEPGTDWPAYAPPLFDPGMIPTAVKVEGAKGKIADIDFTKCQWNWQMGLNLGTLKGKVVKTGKIRATVPPEDEQPKIMASGS